MLHILRFSPQNAVYFIMLTILVPVLFTFNILGVQNLNVKLQCQKVYVYTHTHTNRTPQLGGKHSSFILLSPGLACLPKDQLP
jgi:hypothetical protein